MHIVDMRSDTVTKPSPEMRAAMASAEVGDDVFGDDPTVLELERRVAERFGHEAALFAPSGTMANQICLQVLVPPGNEVLCDGEAHIVLYEMGAAAAYGGISSRTWSPADGALDPALIGSMITPAGGFTVPTKAIAVEQTHNKAGGVILPYADLQALRGIADDAGIALHCDGARIWHASVAEGISLRTYGQLFDTLSVCLSKGLGAPVGSLVVGSAEKIARARVVRKRLGGGMRQVGILAAAGLYALEHNIDRLADDHVRAKRIAERLAPLGVVDPGRVRTNLVLLDLTKTAYDAAGLAKAAAEQGLLASPMGARKLRLITHLDLDDDGADRAADVLEGLLS
ncbi:threonine aldolase family protein [Hamadaea tsunoensis]|uniref:threonine aldolase family protein n=1 Tax=Hamadaea tsunoensis TaxID=53368 RepID=UPI000403A317|nr:GntG family PLP-dependent aldolase [Hamadaea tsunoensis]